jgi:transposase-like protein
MNIIDVFNTFQTQEQAVEYLETVRWKGQPVCPYCGSVKVGRHASGDRAAVRWQCYDCTRAFSATVGTIFHGTHVPLRNWFLCLALMLNAKKSASAYQIARDLGMRRPTVWSMMHRIRVAIANDPKQSDLLHGIVEADETYIGANRSGRGKKHPTDKSINKRGRGTNKKPVIGLMERGGRVVGSSSETGRTWNEGTEQVH